MSVKERGAIKPSTFFHEQISFPEKSCQQKSWKLKNKTTFITSGGLSFFQIPTFFINKSSQGRKFIREK